MNIKLKPVNSADGDAFYFASLPESISSEFAAKMQSFDIISKGTVKIPKGVNAPEYGWSHEFFGSAKKNEAIVKPQYWMEPMACVNILKGWSDKGVVLTLTASGVISTNVTISTFKCENYGAFGNIKYTIKFAYKDDLKIFTTNELSIAAFVKKTKPRETPAAPSSKGNYTVVSGDTLWGIASRKCGGGTNWPKLYNANKDVIEAAAKKHGKSSSDNGHWIYSGTTLALV